MSQYESAANTPAQIAVNQEYHDQASRSRHSSISSQASDASFFSPVPSASRAHYPLPSDVESASEMEDSSGMVPHTMSKEELYQYFRKMQRRSEKYKAKFVQVSSVWFNSVCLSFVMHSQH